MRYPAGKLKTRVQITRIADHLHAEGKTIVHTNGCFDVLHIGHIKSLTEARAQGDILVVSLNSDASVKRLKGPRRPVFPEQERAMLLGALECVDYVVLFEEDRPDENITAIRPTVHAKGGDYTPDSLPEAPLVKSLGGRIYILAFHDGRSTTSVIQQLREEEAK
jgi:D-beta-D-heptose 7-phosphate kinase/D-beta-D-heptose 1-phosphate adenosyltransferase